MRGEVRREPACCGVRLPRRRVCVLQTMPARLPKVKEGMGRLASRAARGHGRRVACKHMRRWGADGAALAGAAAQERLHELSFKRDELADRCGPALSVHLGCRFLCARRLPDARVPTCCGGGGGGGEWNGRRRVPVTGRIVVA